MKTCIDDSPIQFQCPACGHKITKALGWLTVQDDMICPGCESTFAPDMDELKRIREETGKIERDLGRLSQAIKS